jgi:radical SAM protein with 4Fe4S-binding SPASM domain
MCNLDCVYCYRAGSDLSLEIHSDIEKILRELLIPNCAEIELQGTGESLLYSGFDGILESACAAKCKINLITNGLFLSRSTLEKLFLSGCHTVVSIDSSDPKTYQNLRPGGDLARLISNLSYWKILKDGQTCAASPPTLNVHMTLTSQNISGIPSLLKLLKNLDADGLFVSVVRRAGVSDSVWENINLDNNKAGVLKELKRGAECAKKLNLIFNSSTSVEDNPDCQARCKCPAPWEHVYISAKGDIFPCCAYQTSMGNCLEQSFEEIWNGPKFQKLRSSFETGCIPKECLKCMLPWKTYL